MLTRLVPGLWHNPFELIKHRGPFHVDLQPSLRLLMPTHLVCLFFLFWYPILLSLTDCNSCVTIVGRLSLVLIIFVAAIRVTTGKSYSSFADLMFVNSCVRSNPTVYSCCRSYLYWHGLNVQYTWIGPWWLWRYVFGISKKTFFYLQVVCSVPICILHHFRSWLCAVGSS